MKRVPKIGEILPFFDDGKIARHFKAVVADVKPFDTAKNTKITTYNGELKDLGAIWEEQIMDRSIYAKKTDYFIICAIPEYDQSLIYFCRDRLGGWFSMDATGWWQSGRLDVDFEEVKLVLSSSLTDEYKESIKSNYPNL